ncbi:unnamed protein product [Albugo candida]|uniref:Uncharacterized protein n=1 Tax=Albugo candida TaxID=65357 RepID=A0A024GE12_9STRA|nr:unnamed protein product [Albugo candida]|eukprot:CCI44774.1 unnamed protein product [Albugo candida]
MNSQLREHMTLRRTRRSLLDSLRPFSSQKSMRTKSIAQNASDDNLEKGSPCSTATTSSMQSLSEVMSIDNLSGSLESCDNMRIISPLSRRQSDIRDSESQLMQAESTSGKQSFSQSTHSVATFRQLRCSMSYRNTFRNSSSRLTANRQIERPLQYKRAEGDQESRIRSRTECYEQARVRSRTESCGEETDTRGPATLLALKTRRAFQRLALTSSDDEETDGSRSERISDCIEIPKEEYRRFQLQLLHVEEICRERDHQEAYLEEAIEKRVQERVQEIQHKVDERMKNYKHQKDEECEYRIRKLSSSYSDAKRGSGQRLDGRMRRRRTFDKIFHSHRHRSRHSSDSNEESAIRETFCLIDVATMDSLNAQESQLATAPREKLVEMITTLFDHSEVQAKQLEDAKELIKEALRSREEAEYIAHDAIRLTLDLAAQLDDKDRVELEHGSHK